MKTVTVRNVNIGDAPISVQSMTNVHVTDVDKTVEQIKSLQLAGCDIVRIAVPDEQSVTAFGRVRNLTDMPLVADIHFDYRLAIGAMEMGADKIRINPGNIDTRDLVKVIDCAKMHNVPIRIGVNGGSVNKDALMKCNGNKIDALVHSLNQYVKFFEDNNFDNLVLSVKSSDVKTTVLTNRKIASLGYPIHLGVTEAGLTYQGIVKNSIGIGSLLLDGIGNTIRVSLTDDPMKEVTAGIEILRALELRKGVTFVSCPKCGRCKIDLENTAKVIYDYVKNIEKPIKVAVMGCEVNGVGECSDADIGLAGGNGKFAFFRHGEVFKVVDEKDAVELFKREIDLLV